MKAKISELEESRSILEKNYLSRVDGEWNDDVKRNFFDGHVSKIRNEHDSFRDTMERTANEFAQSEKVIKSLLSIILLVFLSIPAYGQQGSQKSVVNAENFPQVSFQWNEYNPDPLQPTLLTLKENGQAVDFTLENIASDSVPETNKTILFLWEDRPGINARYRDQFEFTGRLLYGLLNEDLASDTISTFYIATFNRLQVEGEIFRSRLSSFTSDRANIDAFFLDNKHDTQTRPSAETDLLPAIKEGLDLIIREPKSNARAIVVITAGRNKLASGVEMSPIVIESLQNRVPICFVVVPSSDSDGALAYQLARETYGKVISGKDVDGAGEELLQYFKELPSLHYGRDYTVTFTSKLKRDGKQYPLVLNSHGTDYSIVPYNVPKFSLWVWAKEHLVWAIVLLVLLIAVVTLGTIFGIRFFRKLIESNRTKKEEKQRRESQQMVEQAHLKNRLNTTQQELKKQMELLEKEKKQTKKVEQEERLTRLMHTKNLSPRLIVADQGITHNIASATHTIGRAEDNDMVIPNPTVSQHHAQVVFDGSDFDIVDLKSSNGIVVNGNYVDSATLKNGDVIGLGEVSIKFYL